MIGDSDVDGVGIGVHGRRLALPRSVVSALNYVPNQDVARSGIQVPDQFNVAAILTMTCRER